MKDLKVSVVQWDLKWEDPQANICEIEKILSSKSIETDILVLPEMFSTGFSMNASKISEAPGGKTEEWMKSTSLKLNCAVAGSIATKIDDRALNRFLFVTPSDTFHYDKRHLFRMANEHKNYEAGTERVIVEWRGWRVKLEICYDLRFPVFSRNIGDYDLLLNVANWPAKRSFHWKSLLPARAIENQACVVGVNRIGKDGNGYMFTGNSLAINALGETILDLGSREGYGQAIFSYEELVRYREKFPSYIDADSFTLHL